MHVSQEGYAGWERCCILTGRVRKMGKMLHVNRKSTQRGKDVACFTGRVRKMGKMLHVLQEGYAR
ncbi:hypothetical protein [Bacillus sp. AR13-1]|uniref:hypothetical protein n=1 Tax=Bacillus sp. AR13-1 TaxID=2217833 RepID=UPI001C551489|nr:hypothetical protein [Bacillus sp. AR13-1]